MGDTRSKCTELNAAAIQGLRQRADLGKDHTRLYTTSAADQPVWPGACSAASHAAATAHAGWAHFAGIDQGFGAGVKAHFFQVQGQASVHAGGMLGKPFGQGFGQAGDDFLVLILVMLHHSAHGLQNGGVVAGVAVVGRKAGGEHPALFLGEVFYRVFNKPEVQRQLLVIRGRQELVEHDHKFFVGVVHACIAHGEGGRPVEHGGGRGVDGGGVFHGARA